jgi:hypothetical protein
MAEANKYFPHGKSRVGFLTALVGTRTRETPMMSNRLPFSLVLAHVVFKNMYKTLPGKKVQCDARWRGYIYPPGSAVSLTSYFFRPHNPEGVKR